MTKKIFTGAIILIFCLGLASALNTQTPASRAGTESKQVKGFAWSGNIGWIQFDSPGAQVVLNSDGLLAGRAWSSNIGWVDFTAVAVPAGDGPVTGWSKALAGGTLGSGGWDGLIKMSDNWPNGVHRSGNSLLGLAWGSDVIGWVEFSPTLPAGDSYDCDLTTPGKQTTCIGGGGNNFGVSCSANNGDTEVVLAGAPPSATVTWRVVPAGGVAPYTYNWSGDVSGSGSSVSKVFTAAGLVAGMVSVTDSKGDAGICSDDITISDNSIPVSGAKGKLILMDQSGRILITSQSTAAAATRPVLQIKNTGTAAVANVRIDSIKGSDGADIKGDLKCRLSAVSSPTDWASEWQPCSSLSKSLAVDDSFYFAIQVPTYDSEINDHSPYDVVVKGGADIGLTKEDDTPTRITFEYLVGAVNPR